MDPRYRDVRSSQIPEVLLDNGVNIKIICGLVGDIEGPVHDIVIDLEYLDITVPPETTYRHPTKIGHNVFAYVIEGKGFFCKEKKPFSYEVEGTNYFDMTREPFLDNGKLVLFGHGEEVFVSTEEEPTRFLLMSGKPIGEPVAWYGPIVMNTQEELRVAFEEYREGTFVKYKE
jgi:hypothetical protein